jgi:hypothetical protein
MTPLERADAAKHLLESPVLRAAFADIREDLVKQLETIPFGDVDTAHHATLALQQLQSVQTRLRKYLQEIAIDKEKQRQDNFVKKTRETLSDFLKA